MDNSNNNNSNNNHPLDPFWDFISSLDPNGHQRPGFGVDRSNTGPQSRERFPSDAAEFGPSFAPWGASWTQPWAGTWGGYVGGHGRRRTHFPHHHHRGGHHGRDYSGDEDSHAEDTADTDPTMRDSPEDNSSHPPPPPPPQDPFHPPPPPRDHHPHGPPPPFGPSRGRGGRCGRGGRRNHPPPPPTYNSPFDFRPLMHALSTHPFAQSWQNYTHQYRGGAASATPEQESQMQEQDDAFVPPVDVFSTEKAYVLHVALPGCAKEDIGVSWDGEKVNIAGVVHRPGDEEFLSTLVSSERKVGMFKRSIKLPPPGNSDSQDVDGYGITAKVENGILIVTVPKTDKEWMEIHKVEID